MYNAKLFLIDDVKVIYNYYVAGTGVIDIHNNVTHPAPYYHFSKPSLKDIINKTITKYKKILAERINITDEYLEFIKPHRYFTTNTKIIAILIGDFTGVIWNVEGFNSFGNPFNYNYISFTNNTSVIDSDDVIVDIIRTLSNCTMEVENNYLDYVNSIFATNHVINNDDESDYILLKFKDIIYPYWLIINNNNITLNNFNDRKVIINSTEGWAHNKVDLTSVKCMNIKCPKTLMNSIQKQKVIFLKCTEFDQPVYNPCSANTDINNNVTSPNLDRFTKNSDSSNDDLQLYNPTLWNIRYIFDYINDYTNNGNDQINFIIGKMLIPTLININYIRYAELIIALGSHGISIDDKFNERQLKILDDIYIESKAHSLPVIWVGLNSKVTIESLSNQLSFMMADYGILGDTYHSLAYKEGFELDFDFPMQDYWLEPNHYLGYLSGFLSKRFPISTTNFNDLINKISMHYQHTNYLLNCTLHDQINLIKNYSLNKIEQFATFLLNFILDNEIDNYLSWDLIWMDDKIATIVDIMKLLLEFKNKYVINSDDLGLIYLFALACTMTKNNYTLKDMQNNLVGLIIDFNWTRIDNYCRFQPFEKNLISLYANVLTVSRIVYNNYGGNDE